MVYQVASGWNNTGSLEDISIQPRLGGIRDGVRNIAGDGLTKVDGFSNGILVFDRATSSSEYNSLLTELNVASSVSAKITITLPQNSDRTFQNYNAIITRPNLPDDSEYALSKWGILPFSLTRIHESS